MLKEPVETTLNPSSLTDLELLRFSEEFVHDTSGLPKAFQRELVRRFAQKLIGNI